MIIRSSLLSVALLLATACAREDQTAVRASGSGTTNTPADSDRTAMSQSNEKADLDHLAEIRKALVADDSLSVAAENIQILTRNGNVLLRGKVPSSLERDAVEGHARGCAATRSVDNQIQVEKN